METIKYALGIIQDGRLMIRKKRGLQLWILPGGKPEKGETPEACLVREIKEELDSELDVSSLKFFSTFDDVRADFKGDIRLYFYLGGVLGKPKLSAEIVKLDWTDGKDTTRLSPVLKNHIVPALRAAGILK